MKTVLMNLITLLVLVVLAIGWAWSGLYSVAADVPHTRPVHALLELLRERSIAVRASDIEVPPLDAEALIRVGAGNYDAMCSGCHLAPGMAETELSRGLYPAPPNLAQDRIEHDAEVFWAIKHGIKASGMPAWGKSMADEHIWGLVALIRQLPGMNPPQYRALVASSEGHSHGGGETGHDDERAAAAAAPDQPAHEIGAKALRDRHDGGDHHDHGKDYSVRDEDSTGPRSHH